MSEIEFPRESETDIVVVGAGPNGLIAAAYLTAAGFQVTVVERRYEIGGGLATEEILFPHHYANTHATYHYMVDYLPPLVDFQLEGEGLRFQTPHGQVGGVFEDDYVYLCKTLEDSRDYLARFGLDQADVFGNLAQRFHRIVENILAPATYLPPDPPLDLTEALERTEVGRDMLEISEMSALEILESYPLRDSIRATLLYMACQWGVEPTESGMGFIVPLLVDRGMAKACVYGGSHRLASALARVILSRGGLIIDNAEVVAIETVDGRASGVQLEDGRRIQARRAVLSSLDPQTTFLRLLPGEAVPADLRASAEGWMWDKWSLLSVFFALDKKPTWRENPANGMIGLPDPFLTILGFDGSDDVVSFLQAVERGEIPKAAGHFTCETAFDKYLSQIPGQHVAFFEMPAPYDYPWETRSDGLVAEIVDLLDATFDGFRDSVLQTVVETPKTIEQRLPNMVRGSIKHGDYNPLQMGYNRPNTECSSSRTPIPGLYLCGASVFPGGMIIGGPGYIAAQIVCQDTAVKFPFDRPVYVRRYLETYFPEGKE
jgi:phytoene dehydrogenase-like protein